MKFNNDYYNYKSTNKFINHSGDKFLIEYDLDDNYSDTISRQCLKEKSKLDIKEYVNSFKQETNIKVLLQRFAETGDVSYLHQSNGVYADVSSIPTNINDVRHLVKNNSEKISKAFPGIDLNKVKSFDDLVVEISKINSQKEASQEAINKEEK